MRYATIKLMFINSILAISLLFTLACTYRLAYAYRHFRIKHAYTPASTVDELPSVSVCIPARNETKVMTTCLESVVASHYPKLEIIVLDDSSVDDTSVLIKSFAHAGVRFVEGTPLTRGWLGKNHALKELLKEASGDYIFYMDVDAAIKPDTISQLVAYTAQKNLDMVSVLPQHIDGAAHGSALATLRHWWTIMLHTRKRPAASSTIWLAKRKVLRDRFKAFAAIKEVIQPEVAIARQLPRYRFLISSPSLGVSYAKPHRQQLETARRLYYPFAESSIVRGLYMLGVLASALAPMIVLVVTLLSGHVHAFALVLCGLWLCMYAFYLWRMRVHNRLAGLILFPYIVVQDLVLHACSVWAWMRGTVTWKGRPVKVN